MTKPAHKERIKADLRIKFGTLRAFEERQGLPADSTRDVLRGRKSLRVETAIAGALGRPISKLFPHRKADHPRGIESTKRDDTPQKRDAHRLTTRGF
ncbi:helix-turn-helix domain-containing protein [Brevundimonas vitis]|uniref:Helix-turn-helix domain-containing protein n=1 Tax=Brevundimonas vitisensis TaxID=2800818 RepID=A0ABX7BW28_9CAUL|nr:helix-turn-helix domain-containing protein [Brevundimonas vitisensis]QQQ19710.1 helix-turn-helix domain-containing protein [Brevundimonas vitisensis]